MTDPDGFDCEQEAAASPGAHPCEPDIFAQTYEPLEDE